MAVPKTSLSGVVKEIDRVTQALKALKAGATSPQRKLLDAKIKKLGTLKAQARVLCIGRHPTLNASPLLQTSKKSKK